MNKPFLPLLFIVLSLYDSKAETIWPGVRDRVSQLGHVFNYGFATARARWSPTSDEEQYFLNISGQVDKQATRNLLDHPESVEFLKQYRVVVSLTTSPTRIRYLKRVVDNLDLEFVDRIYLNIPEQYGRSNEKYVIPSELLDYPKLVINRIANDLGPISKIVPGIERARKELGRSVLVVSIDDDTAYPKNFINEFIAAFSYEKKMTLGLMGGTFWNFGIKLPPKAKHQKVSFNATLDHFYRDLDILYGFAGIGYLAENMDTENLKRLASVSKYTYLSDDLVLAIGSKVPLRRLNSSQLSIGNIIQYRFGFLGDSLFSSGKKLTAVDSIKSVFVDGNRFKYQQAFKDIIDFKKSTSCKTFYGQ